MLVRVNNPESIRRRQEKKKKRRSVRWVSRQSKLRLDFNKGILRTYILNLSIFAVSCVLYFLGFFVLRFLKKIYIYNIYFVLPNRKKDNALIKINRKVSLSS